MVDIYALITFLSAILNLFLGVLVFSRGIKKPSNIVFFLMTISTTTWVVSVYLSDYFKLPEKALLFVKLANISATWAIYLFLIFTFIFPKEIKSFFNQIKFYSIILPIIFSIMFFNKFFITGIKIEEWGSTPILGRLIPIHFGYLFVTILFGVRNLVRKYRKSVGIEKEQLKFISFGLILTAISAILLNALVPLIIESARSAKLAPTTTIFFLLFTFLAITRYHLFGIEVILTEILVALIGILLLVQIFVAPTILWRIVNSGIFVLFCIFGYLLIRGVFREIKRREELEKIAQRERALREEAERLAQEFQRLDKVKNQFILTTQHHLRTPLSIIKGYLATILGGIYGEIKNQKINQALKNTLLATQRLITLVNEFLDISQFQIGKGALKKEEINLKDVLNEVVLELKPEAEKKKLYLKMIFEAKDLKLKADFQRLKEAFFNLIDNAIKYTQKGGVEIKVESKAPETLLVSIKDTGIGMSKETLSKIFKGLFERGKEAEAVELTGKGIGLFISKTLIDAHGGKIWADSQGPGKGSTFFVELPKK
jgi:signal transduction histidine kinase